MEKSKKKEITMNINLMLPPNIIEVIFSKLPIFNLPFCRLVCNNWNDLILNYYSSTSKIIPHTLFICTLGHSMYSIDFDPNYLGGISFVASLGSEDHYMLRLSSIMCSCNGLLLIYTSVTKHLGFDILNPMTKEYQLDILNPMTNEYFKLWVEDYSYHRPRSFYFYGFGFSLKTKRYKVVRVLRSSNQKYNLEIFTIGGSNNQWRCVEQHVPFLIRVNGVYFNGALYWIGLNRRENVIEYVIWHFDLENERIKSIISLPVAVPSLGETLEAFNGSVYAAFLFKNSCYEIEVWKMQNCGREDSWAREFVIRDVPKNWVMPFLNTYFKFVKCNEDGEILCLINGRFYIRYNPKYGSVKILNQFELSMSFCESICRLDSCSFGSLQKILAGDDG